MVYNADLDNLYVGLEDVRMFPFNGELLYNCNRGLGSHKLAVEHGKVRTVMELDVPRMDAIIKMEGQREVEKNWVLFEDANGNLKCIYDWHELVIGDIVDKSAIDSDDEVASVPPEYEFVPTHKIDTPLVFKYFRGSTNGVRIGNEIWFICHAVSYEDPRYYYHSFITLDAETYEVKRYTPFMTFDGEKVEYTLGFVHRREGNQFLIGYSKMDNSTHYIAVKKSVIEGMMMT